MGGVYLRGVIEHRKRAQQIIDFCGIHYENITPTDIDGVIEYKDKAYVYLEYKYGKKEMPYGQRLFLERAVKDNAKAGKTAIAIVAEHTVENPENDIPADSCKVREIFYSKEMKWRKPKRNFTVKQLTDAFVDLIEQKASF